MQRVSYQMMEEVREQLRRERKRKEWKTLAGVLLWACVIALAIVLLTGCEQPPEVVSRFVTGGTDGGWIPIP